MKNVKNAFSCTLMLFSFYACGMAPDETSAIIRKNAQKPELHQSVSEATSAQYTLKLNNNRVFIPAAKLLVMPRNEDNYIITHMVNYSDIQEARELKHSGSTFTLE